MEYRAVDDSFGYRICRLHRHENDALRTVLYGMFAFLNDEPGADRSVMMEKPLPAKSSTHRLVRGFDVY